MFKFVVVEDETNSREIIKKVLRKISIKNDNQIDIVYFDAFNNDLKKEIMDTTLRKVYIMDIELKGKSNGIDIARMIREKDWDSEIIFVTSHDKMFEYVHRNVLEVFDFIEKFLDMEERLERDIEKIYSKKYDKKTLKILNRAVDLEIYLRNINYILRDKEERKIIIYTKETVFKVAYNLNEIMELLDSRFVKVHRSCIVNKDNVSEYNFAQGYFTLNDGTQVDYLSKKYRKEIEQ